MRSVFIASLILTLVGSGCSSGSTPIEYGVDDCHYCQMRIMDSRFGSEAITDKGRMYKFDSIECLLRYLNETDQAHDQVLITAFTNPRELVDANGATYLVSKQMPSPMGGFLNGFLTQEEAAKFQEKEGGDLFSWGEIKASYAK